MGDAKLEPESFGANGDCGIGDRGDFFGAAEDVDDVDGDGDIFEAGIGFLAEDFGFVGVDGDDGVAGALEVGGDFVGGTKGVGGEADYGDDFGLAEEIGDEVEGWTHLVGEMELHDRWMNVIEIRIKEDAMKGKSLRVEVLKKDEENIDSEDTESTEDAEKRKDEEKH